MRHIDNVCLCLHAHVCLCACAPACAENDSDKHHVWASGDPSVNTGRWRQRRSCATASMSLGLAQVGPGRLGSARVQILAPHRSCARLHQLTAAARLPDADEAHRNIKGHWAIWQSAPLLPGEERHLMRPGWGFPPRHTSSVL